MHSRAPPSLNVSPCCSKKEKRLQQEELRNIKTLGESGQDVDDLAAWVERNRKAEAQLKAEERAKAEKLARQLEEQVSLSLLQHKSAFLRTVRAATRQPHPAVGDWY